jgi:hypothetical protein
MLKGHFARAEKRFFPCRQRKCDESAMAVDSAVSAKNA